MDKSFTNHDLSSITDKERSKIQRRYFEENVRKDVDTLKWILDNAEGRYFLMRLFDRCKIFAKNAGEESARSVGLGVYEDIVSNFGKEGVELRQKAELEYLDFQKNTLMAVQKEIAVLREV